MLQIKNLSKSYSDGHQELKVFESLTLSVSVGEFVALLGPNGCGKSTLLDILANLLDFDGGEIILDGKQLDSIKTGYVFQDYRSSLLPWLSAEDNIAFPLKLKGQPKHERVRKVGEMYHRFGCTFDLKAYPYQLSDGQQQLVSVLRGLVIEPELLLLDEPFCALDYQTHLLMLEEFLGIWQRSPVTTLYVSHQIDEAIFLSERIVVLSEKPTTILETFANPLPYPRQLDCIGSSEFVKLREEILRASFHQHQVFALFDSDKSRPRVCGQDIRSAYVRSQVLRRPRIFGT